MKLPRRKFLHLAAAAAALPALSHGVWAQSYPARPVTLIVFVPAGGAPDRSGFRVSSIRLAPDARSSRCSVAQRRRGRRVGDPENRKYQHIYAKLKSYA